MVGHARRRRPRRTPLSAGCRWRRHDVPRSGRDTGSRTVVRDAARAVEHPRSPASSLVTTFRHRPPLTRSLGRASMFYRPVGEFPIEISSGGSVTTTTARKRPGSVRANMLVAGTLNRRRLLGSTAEGRDDLNWARSCQAISRRTRGRFWRELPLEASRGSGRNVPLFAILPDDRHEPFNAHRSR